jgi:hypothetical protein
METSELPLALGSETIPGPEPKSPWFDAACAILMAASSLCTAWCTYQNSRWSGQTASLQAESDTAEREAMAMILEARQFEMAHLHLATEAVNAILEGNQKRLAFYTARFTGELKPAWDKWMELNPFENASAPPHPFVAGLYKARFADEILAKQTAAAKASTQSKLTGRNAGGYLSNTVLLATVLFFAGTAGKFDQSRVRVPSLGFAAALFIFAAVRMVLLPVA